jgi:hypothetical protein
MTFRGQVLPQQSPGDCTSAYARGWAPWKRGSLPSTANTRIDARLLKPETRPTSPWATVR